MKGNFNESKLKKHQSLIANLVIRIEKYQNS